MQARLDGDLAGSILRCHYIMNHSDTLENVERNFGRGRHQVAEWFEVSEIILRNARKNVLLTLRFEFK